MTIGFMQGRLSPVIDNKIQAFPWQHWETEFQLAKQHCLGLMEWTLDNERLSENPFMLQTGQQTIIDLKNHSKLEIKSLTADFFMQAPFYKQSEQQLANQYLNDLERVIRAASALDLEIIVLPLVDNGSLTNSIEEDRLLTGLLDVEKILYNEGLKVAFESDYPPAGLKSFIAKLNPAVFGINYDIGNSAAMGYDVEEEFLCYGDRVIHVHVKDRLYLGQTVPLGEGAADMPAVFSALKKCGYSGDYILQTARANHDHVGDILKYKNMVEGWI